MSSRGCVKSSKSSRGERMRLFTAVRISEEAKKHLLSVQGYLRQDWVDAPGMESVKWTTLDNLHITLKFLGEVSDDRLPELRDALGQIEIEPMKLWCDRIERFPPRGLIRVIAAGIGGDAGRLTQLFDRVDECAVPFGIEADRRRYTPHVTIGRSRRGLPFIGSAMGEVDVSHLWPGPTFESRSFDLVKSTLSEDGPVYEVLETYPVEK